MRTFHVDHHQLNLPQQGDILFSPVGGGEAMLFVEEKFGIKNTHAELVGSTWVVRETRDPKEIGAISGDLLPFPAPSRLRELEC